ncbi:hypothetical protein ACFXKC_28265 [Streptomyces sp. NPDC059340]|uniref:hypothetical protein n=1 Tax=Streptomyces sp. NPDC059340 TaxID=3346806 RepID=UPI0036A60211
MNRIRLYLHRLFRRPALTGPMRLYIRRIPTGAGLDLEEYFVHVIETIADDSDLLDLFMEIVEDRGISRGHDGWEPEKLLMERLAEAVGHEIPVRGKTLLRLADRLHRAAVLAAPVSAVPAQREAGAA